MKFANQTGFVAACPALFAQAQALQKVTINYPNRSGSNWPLFIAKEGGYLSEVRPGCEAGLRRSSRRASRCW